MNSKHIKYFIVFALLAVVCLIGDTCADPVMVELVDSKVIPPTEAEILAQHHDLKYIVSNDRVTYGVPVDIIKKPPEPVYLDRVDGWTCFDYSMDRTRQNPEWGIVLISTNPKFEGYKSGDNHFVNYKINDDKSLLINDEFLQNEYTARGWQYDTQAFDYYHFYIDGEIPTRAWARNALKPNAEVVYSAL